MESALAAAEAKAQSADQEINEVKNCLDVRTLAAQLPT